MRLLQASVTVVLLCVGANAGIANDIYAMTKFAFCGVPESDSGVLVSITSSAFSQDGARVAIGTHGRIVRVCETATGRAIASIAVPTARDKSDEHIEFVAFSPDGTRVVTVSRDRAVRLWEIAGGRELATLQHPEPVASATFSPDGTRLATLASDWIGRIWDVAGGREVAVLEPQITSVVFSPDGSRLVATGWEGTVHIRDAATGREISVLKGHEGKVNKARFSPDGGRIVTASDDKTVRVFDAASGRELRSLKHLSRVSSVAFSADGARIVTGDGKDARVFDAASGREIAALKGHGSAVNDAAFSRDGTRIATASDDRSVRLWDARSGAEIAKLEGDFTGVDTVMFDADGRRILATGVTSIMWTKRLPTSLPASLAGLWFANIGGPDEPAEFTRERCVRSPIRINGDGLIVFFDTDSSAPPLPVMHLRCAPDLTCQSFAGAPAQGVEARGTGKLEVSGNAGKLCLDGECQPIVRCLAPKWTDQQRKSGFAKQWETEVNVRRR
jgi:WD40 repeat protein